MYFCKNVKHPFHVCRIVTAMLVRSDFCKMAMSGYRTVSGFLRNMTIEG